SVQGLRPSTVSSPWKGVSPRMAFSAVVLPAPFGPIKPTMRPSATRKSIPSSARVEPKDLRRPRASRQSMGSALLVLAWPGLRFQQVLRRQPQTLDGGKDARPLFGEKFLALRLQQHIRGALPHEHPHAAALLDQLFVDQFLVAFEYGQRIDPKFRRHVAHRGQRVALFQDAVEDHGDDTVSK